MTDPLQNPQPGDSVKAIVNGANVTRTMRYRISFSGRGFVEIGFRDSRYRYVQFGSLKSWRRWCKKNNAEVVL